MRNLYIVIALIGSFFLGGYVSPQKVIYQDNLIDKENEIQNEEMIRYEHEIIVSNQKEELSEGVNSSNNINASFKVVEENSGFETIEQVTNKQATNYKSDINENKLDLGKDANNELEDIVTNLNHKIQNEDNNLFELEDLVDQIIQIDEDALDSMSIRLVIMAVLNDSNQSTLKKFSALNQLNGLVGSEHIQLIEQLFYDHLNYEKEIAWQALNLTNASVLYDESIEFLNKVKSDLSVPNEFVLVIDEILLSKDSDQTYNMSNVMMQISQVLQEELLQ